MCIIITVKESSFDVTVCHFSFLTSVLFIVDLVVYSVKRESGYCFRLYCLLANVIGTFHTNLGQPYYVRLMSKSKITRKEAMLS